MKLSVVIPTRERSAYLEIAIKSALLAANTAGCEVEVLVADNASRDDTAMVVSKIFDSRVVSVRSERRLSMRGNFEFALSKASGSHLVFVGDDDAVLPNGLRILAELVRIHDPEIVKWRVLNYLWPDSILKVGGRLKVRPQLLDGRLQSIDPNCVLRNFARASFRTYHEGGMIYHGCVSRRLIERIMASSSEPYFRGSSPDVYASLQALMIAEGSMVKLNTPLTLGGRSARSNGAAGQDTAVEDKKVKGSEFGLFIAESESDPWQCSLPASCPSLDMVVLDCLRTAVAVHKIDLPIDFVAWQQRIARSTAGFAGPAYETASRQAREVFGMELPPWPGMRAKATAATDSPRLPSTQSSRAQINDATRLSRGLSKLTFTGGEAMRNAATAASLLDELLDLGEFRKPSDGVAEALCRVVRQHLRAPILARRHW